MLSKRVLLPTTPEFVVLSVPGLCYLKSGNAGRPFYYTTMIAVVTKFYLWWDVAMARNYRWSGYFCGVVACRRMKQALVLPCLHPPAEKETWPFARELYVVLRVCIRVALQGKIKIACWLNFHCTACRELWLSWRRAKLLTLAEFWEVGEISTCVLYGNESLGKILAPLRVFKLKNGRTQR